MYKFLKLCITVTREVFTSLSIRRVVVRGGHGYRSVERVGPKIVRKCRTD